MNASAKITNAIAEKNSLVCVGLDPQLDNIPKKFLSQKNPLFSFNKQIIDQTIDFASAYKPNIAFYEAYGIEGLKQLKKTIDYLKLQKPQIPVILDAKRADIPNTAKMYAKAIYEYWDADSATVYPNLGKDSLEPFFSYQDKLSILIIKTSNPNSGEFQNLMTTEGLFYLQMAQVISRWKENNYGIFAGATYPQELRKLRNIFPDKIFLSAGIGIQKADNKKAVKAGVDKSGGGILFNASRSIIYAQDPQKAAKYLRDEINSYR